MTRVGSVYGEALYGLAKEDGVAEQILTELKVLNASFGEEPGFVRLLSAPNLPKEERCKIIDDSFAGRIQPHLLNFMKILTEKGYMRCFGDCCAAYCALYNEDHGILSVKAITAVSLTAEQIAKLSEKLAELTGKTIELQNKIDPACLGGIRLDYDGKRVDDTVRHRLDAIHSLLKNTVL